MNRHILIFPKLSRAKKHKTTAEKAHMDKVAALGCVICKLPAEIHHVKDKTNRNRDHFRILPLCPHHHRKGGSGVAYHSGKIQWEKNFATQSELLAQVNRMLHMKNKLTLAALCWILDVHGYRADCPIEAHGPQEYFYDKHGGYTQLYRVAISSRVDGKFKVFTWCGLKTIGEANQFFAHLQHLLEEWRKHENSPRP